jgi:hypothetical protein
MDFGQAQLRNSSLPCSNYIQRLDVFIDKLEKYEQGLRCPSVNEVVHRVMVEGAAYAFVLSYDNLPNNHKVGLREDYQLLMIEYANWKKTDDIRLKNLELPLQEFGLMKSKVRVVNHVYRLQTLVVLCYDEGARKEETAFCLCLDSVNSTQTKDIRIAWFYECEDGNYLLGDKVETITWDNIEAHNITVVYNVDKVDFTIVPIKKYYSTKEYKVENISITCNGMLNKKGLHENPFGIVWT